MDIESFIACETVVSDAHASVEHEPLPQHDESEASASDATQAAVNNFFIAMIFYVLYD